ncbi:MAG: hypothetical protein KAS63_06835 [Candidatus Heimdallarchaeota archaeon]|nr:hypothetical protein [Candidatus Heimdallarchaeota archaeon]MCK4955060.1 hypothetical protein [Candidatus Heimdallarchaeota archaeon]
MCKNGGYIVALTEPDYQGWIENPDFGLSKYHKETIEKQGGDPLIGRKLLSIFSSGGLETTIHINSRIWSQSELEGCIEKEWNNIYAEGLISEEELKSKIEEEKKIIAEKLKLLFYQYLPLLVKK